MGGIIEKAGHPQRGALEKQQQTAGLDLCWHFIGSIQSNKTRQIAGHFDWVHAIDREKIAKRLNDQRPEHLPPLDVCIQVNIDDEASKTGVTPQALPALAAAVAALPRLRLRGLMCLPAIRETFDEQRIPFRRLRELKDELNDTGLGLDTLSMGMTGDFPAAIAEGATIVRVGTALFGERPKDGNG